MSFPQVENSTWYDISNFNLYNTPSTKNMGLKLIRKLLIICMVVGCLLFDFTAHLVYINIPSNLTLSEALERWFFNWNVGVPTMAKTQIDHQSQQTCCLSFPLSPCDQYSCGIGAAQVLMNFGRAVPHLKALLRKEIRICLLDGCQLLVFLKCPIWYQSCSHFYYCMTLLFLYWGW